MDESVIPAENTDLTDFWRSATLPIPILIVGAGRWARVWAQVIQAARGTNQNVFMVSRTNPSSVVEWKKQNQQFSDLVVYSSISEAVEKEPKLKVAIICSRPLHHCQDTINALSHKLHVLVEKPISTDFASGSLMADSALRAQRILWVGTEFFYLPALHQCAKTLKQFPDSELKATLRWEDPPQEFRYGLGKVRHEEIRVQTDLLPHAFSIFNTLAPQKQALFINNATSSTDTQRGYIDFRDDLGGSYKFIFDVMASRRVRELVIHTKHMVISLDFCTEKPLIKINGNLEPLNLNLAHMTSSLRLELGAFLLEVEKNSEKTVVHPNVLVLLSLQNQLDSFYPL